MLNLGKSFENNNVSKNRYLYNGKELQDQVIGGMAFGWYDYGARFYDPELGRWHSVDPLAEATSYVIIYHYCLNNLLSNIDPTGMWTENAIGWTTNEPQEMSEFMKNTKGSQNKAEDPQKKY